MIDDRLFLIVPSCLYILGVLSVFAVKKINRKGAESAKEIAVFYLFERRYPADYRQYP